MLELNRCWRDRGLLSWQPWGLWLCTAKNLGGQTGIVLPVSYLLSYICSHICSHIFVLVVTKHLVGITVALWRLITSVLYNRVWTGVLRRNIKICGLVHALWQRGYPTSLMMRIPVCSEMLHPLFHLCHLKTVLFMALVPGASLGAGQGSQGVLSSSGSTQGPEGPGVVLPHLLLFFSFPG